jgi:hypothetical protein
MQADIAKTIGYVTCMWGLANTAATFSDGIGTALNNWGEFVLDQIGLGEELEETEEEKKEDAMALPPPMIN